MILDPALHDRGRLGEVLASVDAEDVVGLQDVERQDLPTHGHEACRGVGEVILLLGVAGADLVEGVPEAGQLEDVAARVDLGDDAFLGRAVAFLDDPEEPARGVAEDAAESGGIRQDGRAEQAGGAVVLLAAEQVGQRLRPEQRLVAHQDQGGTAVVAQHRPANLGGVTGSELLVLVGEQDVGLVAQVVAHLLGGVSDHDDDGLRPGPSGGVDDVADHRLPADLVQHLGLLRLHPLPMAGGQDDRDGSIHDIRFSAGGLGGRLDWRRVRRLMIGWGLVGRQMERTTAMPAAAANLERPGRICQTVVPERSPAEADPGPCGGSIPTIGPNNAQESPRMSLSNAEVAKVALLARLRVSPEELETFTGQLNSIVDYVAQLQEVDTEGVEPLAHGVEVRNVFRDDVRGEPLPRDQALANAPKRNATSFLVPAVLD